MSKLAYGSSIGPFAYRILAQVGEGEGGMSHLYKATTGRVESPRQSDLVVLKIVNIENNPDFHRETLDNEVETLRRLSTPGHRGIVKILPVEAEHIRARSVYTAQASLRGAPWFFVLEYLAGGSLADLVKSKKKLEIGLALHLTAIVLEILQYTHEQGFVHLDIKPENIMFRHPVSDSLDVVLVDFGIARGPGQFGLEAGTVIWSPPERIAGTVRQLLPPESVPPPHPSMDVYAVGLLLYFMVTGRMPFTGRSRNHVTTAILEGNPTVASKYEPLVNSELDRLILGALAKSPSGRPSTNDFIRRIRLLQEKYPYQFRRIELAGSPDTRESRRPGHSANVPWIWIAVAAIALVVVMVLFAPGFATAQPGSADAPTATAEVIHVPVTATDGAEPTTEPTPRATVGGSPTPSRANTSTPVPTRRATTTPFGSTPTPGG